MVARLHARGRSVWASRFAALVELPVRDLAALVDERDPVGHLVGRQLEQVREVVVPLNVCHRSEGRTRSISSQNGQVSTAGAGSGGGFEVFVDAVGAVDAADPAVQRRQPHLHEDARDAHLARRSALAFGALHGAGDDRRHDLGDPPHDVGVLGLRGAERPHHRRGHVGMPAQRRGSTAGAPPITRSAGGRLGRRVGLDVGRGGRPAARPSPRGAAAPSTRSTGRRCRARRRPRRRRRASARRRNRRRPASSKVGVEHPAPARGLAAGQGLLSGSVRRSSPAEIETCSDFLRGKALRPLPDCAAWPTPGWTSSNSPTSSSPARPRSGRTTRSPRSGTMAEVQPRVAFVDAFANSSVVDTDDGLVAVDTSGVFHARHVHETVRSWSPAPPRHRDLHARPHRPRVRRRPLRRGGAHQRLGSAAASSRTQRSPTASIATAITAGYNAVINQRQFRAPALRWPTDYRYPDETYTRPPRARGRRRALRALPRSRRDRRRDVGLVAGTRASCSPETCSSGRRPTAATRRRCSATRRDWAAAFRKMDALEPDLLLPGHGLPIVGARSRASGAHRRRGAARVAASSRRSR